MSEVSEKQPESTLEPDQTLKITKRLLDEGRESLSADLDWRTT